MGLYSRFMKSLEFEAFVVDVFEKYYGGSAFVTVATGDYGVNFIWAR